MTNVVNRYAKFYNRRKQKMKWIKINESNDNGMLTEEEFSKKYNKRECDKCCKKC